MAFQLSPGVLVTEKELTSVVPVVGASNGAFAGSFAWGPVMDPVSISSENQLVARFGKPADGNASSFFTAANFLSYTNSLQVVRVEADDARNAVTTATGSVTGVTITNGGTLYANVVVAFGLPNVAGGVRATGTAVVVGGVITFINIVEPGTGYTSAPSITITSSAGSGFVGTAVVTSGGIAINNENDYMDTYVNGGGVVGEFAAKYPGVLGNSITISMADGSNFATWDYAAEFDSAPSTSAFVEAADGADDEMHVIVLDALGLWTGTRGAILEKYAYISKASDARKTDGANNYYRDVINANSKYIWWMDHPTSGTNWGTTALQKTFADLSNTAAIFDGGVTLVGGVTDLSPTDGQLQAGFALFANAELYDVSLIPCGGVSAAVSKYVIEQVAEVRKDCVAFASPLNVTTGEIITGADAAAKVVEFRNDASFNVNSSYAVLDSGYKYQYDRYNDLYRWVPLNGDIAGLCARTDYTNDAWWSPSGLNRGQIKNVVKLAFNPTKTDRDELYKAGVNPVVSFPGQGIVLFGDKTLLSKPSAFDRINVRRLFIVLEKAIATAAKFQLFEFNDGFTRAQFRSLVEPFLRDVQGRRGVVEFRVKCDETNNTSEVIDRNEFVASIFIKPTRVINFISLNFVATRSGVSFDEIGG